MEAFNCGSMSFFPTSDRMNAYRPKNIIVTLGKCHFLPGGGGAPENWGDQVLCLRSKGGIKRFFQIKKGGSFIFFKEIKYFVKHSWNSC